MTTNNKITVAAWSESQDPIIPQKRSDRRFCPPAFIGIVGTLLLHSLALHTALQGSRAHKAPPDVPQPGSSLKDAEASPAESLVFIDIPKTTTTDYEMSQALASIRAAIKETPANLPDASPPREVEILPLNDDKPPESSAGSGDGAELARLFGIYTGQIQARVERVWKRPRTPVNEGEGHPKATHGGQSFQCQVQVVQDNSGNVQEILLPRCNGTPAWQRSLVVAIQQASPLPAPPSASVFSHSITLNFVGLEHIAGSPDEDYEMVPIRTVQAISTPPANHPIQILDDALPNGPPSPPPESNADLDQTTN